MFVLRHFGSLVVWGAALLLQVHGIAVWGARYEATVEFYVVPEQWLDTPDVADHFLPDAEVLLYAEGAFEPAMVASAHTPVRIPPGVWTATASAPGYVSTTASTLYLPDSPETAEVRSRVLLTVVEACEIRLEDAPKAWRGIQRVDFVSLEHGSVYPHHPLSDRRIRVPAGSVMVYTIAVRGLDALAGPLPCRFARTEQLARPEPPSPGKHSFMIHSAFPQGAEADLEALSAVLHSSAQREAETYLLRTAGTPDAEAYSAAAREPLLPPSARTASGNRVSFFFIDAPAKQEAQRLVLEHPRLRSDEVLVTPQDRGVRDFGLRRLKARRAITFGIHYRPLRPHEDERILLYDCGDEPQPACDLWIADCRRLPPELRLQPGMASYRIDDLDDGQYMLVAQIDDEAVPHLGNRYCPYLDPETDDAPPDPGVLPLREMHIYGHLLVDDEPVPGEVRLEYGPGGPLRRFPTDERLEYRLFYYGEKPGESELNRLFPEAGPDDAGESSTCGCSGKRTRVCWCDFLTVRRLPTACCCRFVARSGTGAAPPRPTPWAAWP